MRICKWLSLSVVVILASCGRDPISLEGFDAEKWREDRFACRGSREELSSLLLKQKQSLLAHNEIEIVRVLGKPDENELYKRNEKFFYYYVQPSSRCGKSSAAPKRLIIRFNALGLAKEILIE